MPWETVGTEIRHRLRDPGDFQPGSFRRITVKHDKPRVFGIIGKLKGETSTAMQSLRFPIDDGWTVEKAQTWVKKHYTKNAKEFNAMSNHRETKDFRFEVKDINEAGQFTGYASVYGITDAMNDIVEPGAFTKTIQERGASVPVLWQHNSDEPIGIGSLSDSERGLIINGKLELELQAARDAYVRLRSGLVKGLSIGYRSIVDKLDNGKRLLKEIKLYEVSLVVFPANEEALVTAVKEDDLGVAVDPEAELNKTLDLVLEQKAGRMISAANRSRIAQAISVLEALLADDESSTPDKGAAGTAGDQPHKDDSLGPEKIHSLLEQFKSTVRRSL